MEFGGGFAAESSAGRNSEFRGAFVSQPNVETVINS